MYTTMYNYHSKVWYIYLKGRHFLFIYVHHTLFVFVAVMQSLARKNEWPLDKMHLTVDVTKKFKEEFNQPAREGAYIYGLYMEGLYHPSNHRPLLSANQNAFLYYLSRLCAHESKACACDCRCTLGYSRWDNRRSTPEGTNPQHACYSCTSHPKRPTGDTQHLRMPRL